MMSPDAMIGLSLPLSYLVGDPDANRANRAWQAALGESRQALVALKSAGVGSVELRAISPRTDPSLALHAARRVWDAGLSLTVHGSLPEPPLGDTFAELFPELVPLVEALSERGCQSVVTLHCYHPANDTVEESAERTVQALRQVTASLEREQIPLRIALENDRLSGQETAGVAYEGVLGMVERVASPRVGICWDFGHAYWNVRLGRLEPVPPAGFLQRAIHTHIHDLGPRTHYPLTCGVVPLELYLDLLLAAGYGGVYNLELSPDRYPEAPVRELVYASIERLARHLRRRSSLCPTGESPLPPGAA